MERQAQKGQKIENSHGYQLTKNSRLFKRFVANACVVVFWNFLAISPTIVLQIPQMYGLLEEKE
jgi:hypothetical protein